MRKSIIAFLFNHSQRLYTKFFKKNKPWNITRAELLKHPKDSIGLKLGNFLLENNFQLMDKVERHDIFHIITGYGTTVEDEIALQFLCHGNGKRSPYMLGVITLGTFLLPEYLPYFMEAHKIGRGANKFHQYDFKDLLLINYEEFRVSIFTESQQHTLYRLQND